MKKSTPKPISLLEFNEQFGTEEQCREHLFEKRFGKGFKCPKCGHEHGVKVASRLLMQCSKCHHQVSVTSGTVMNNTKIPIQKWYYAIYLITSGKRGLSAKELQRQIKVTYKTAWYVNKRIREAMVQAESKYKLEGTVSIDEAYFSGRKSGENTGDTPNGRGNKPNKRGRGTNKATSIKVIFARYSGKRFASCVRENRANTTFAHLPSFMRSTLRKNFRFIEVAISRKLSWLFRLMKTAVPVSPK